MSVYVTDKANLMQEKERLCLAMTCKKASSPASRHCFYLVVIWSPVKNVPTEWKTVLLARQRYWELFGGLMSCSFSLSVNHDTIRPIH